MSDGARILQHDMSVAVLRLRDLATGHVVHPALQRALILEVPRRELSLPSDDLVESEEKKGE